ncbi:plasmid mobilization protein [Geminisphaera colitermitum]|uniref:plasmid mobilization protein n=1 Tax=Geminisphaera colitermitum TaxID=1148786 RepID=UPI000158CED6|nr:hypothetical protein [Geminisphaera colitermitum]
MPTITFKVTDEEAQELRRKARLKKMTVSDYLRRSAFPAPARPVKRIIKKNPISGALCDYTPGPIVTEEQIKAALADFP